MTEVYAVRAEARGMAARLRLGLIVAASIVSCSAIWAQNTAQINGTVTDASGAALPGVQIMVTQTATNAARTTTSGADGSYVLPDLPIGPYTLVATKSGFAAYKQPGIVLQVATNPTIDVHLQVGNVSDQVVVQATAVQVETEESGVGQTMDNQRVLELPLAARDSQNLVLIAGAAVGGGADSSAGNYPVNLISIAGAQTDSVTYVLDGGTYNENYAHATLPPPFPDALQEFRVESSAVPPQYGGAGGAVEMVTKSGTNQFHGTAFEFLRNGDLDARNAFSAVRDQLKRNQFGGVIGGPIKKDKLFFFFGDQFTRTVSAPTTTISTVPTAAMLAGDWTAFTSPACNGGRQITLKAPFVNNMISPTDYSAPAVALTQQKDWVIPTNPCGIDSYNESANSNEQMIDSRVDYQMSAKNSLFVRPQAALLTQPTSFNGTDLLSLVTANYVRHAMSLVAGDTYVINSSTVALFHATAVRTSNVRSAPGNGDFSLPQLGVQGLYYPPPPFPLLSSLSVSGEFNLNTGIAPNYENGTTFQETGDITMTRGTHQIGFGANLLHAYFASINTVNASGEFVFNSSNTGSALGDLMLGKSTTYEQSAPATTYLMQYNADLYAQDTWKVNRHLTLSGGLRWEPFLPDYSKFAQMGVFTNQWFLEGLESTVYPNAPVGFLFPGDPEVSLGNSLENHDWARFNPRLDVAWDPKGDGKTVLRAAAGKFSDDIHLSADSSNIALEPPTGGRVNLSGVSLANPWAGIPGGNPFPLTFGKNAIFPQEGTDSTIIPGIKHPTVWEWNGVIQKQVTPDWLATAAYSGSLASHETSGNEGNPGVYIPGNCVAGQYGLTAAGPCSTNGNVNQRRLFTIENPVEGPYYSNMATVNDSGTRSYNGLELSLQGRVGSGFTTLANYTWSHCIDYGVTTNQTTIQTWDLAQREVDRGNCELDRRQNFNLSVVYQVPRFSDRVARLLASGWEASTVGHVISGAWVSVLTGNDNSLTGTSDQFPNLVPGVSPYLSNRGTGCKCWLNPAAFTQPAAGTFGAMHSQAIQGPGAINFDAALAHLFPIKERLTAQLRAEAFNLFNHFNPGGATAPAIGATTAGINGPPTLNSGIDLTLSDTTFGQLVNAADPRIMQVALKLTF